MVDPAADELKQLGNKAYSQQKFREAVDYYTRAINKNSRVPTYYTNRALANVQLSKWTDVVSDCQKAMELDKMSIKAFYLCGKAEIQLELWDDAIKHLARAADLSSQQQTANYGDEIHMLMRTARRGKFRMEEDKRVHQEIDLVRFVENLIDQNVADQLAHRMSLNENNDGNGKRDEEETRILEEAKNYKKLLNDLLAQVDERRRRREIPDYLCGKISFELMKDPVITPSGITYDRNDIKQHLHRVGHFDPVSRESLTEAQLIPNLAMKEVIESFLKENPWAEFDDDDS